MSELQFPGGVLVPVCYKSWSQEGLAAGTLEAAQIRLTNVGQYVIGLTQGQEQGSWTSPWHTPEQSVERVVASWQTSMPDIPYDAADPPSVETWLQVRDDNQQSGWFSFGRWSTGTTVLPNGDLTSVRGSAGSQHNEWGQIAQDTYIAPKSRRIDGFRLRQMLFRGAEGEPLTRLLAAVASRRELLTSFKVSETTLEEAIELDVPALSQYQHRGEYAKLNGGGEAWCSSTAIAMVLCYFGKLPSPREIIAMPSDIVFDAHNRQDSVVTHAALHTFDNGQAKKDTGNWSFNTAYATDRGVPASVQQFDNLQAVEQEIKRGFPVVATLKWDNEDSNCAFHLDDAPIDKTDGHLLVIRGFTKQGDVIVNDPAAPHNREVRRIYKRAQFEYNWLRSKGGVVYTFDK